MMSQNCGRNERVQKLPSGRLPRNTVCRCGQCTSCASEDGNRTPMGTLYKRAGSRKWMMAVTVAGRQRCKSTHTSNKRLADQMLSRWEAEVFEGRFQLPKSNPPRFEAWADDFLQTVSHPNTRRRYTSSVGKLKSQ